MAYSSISISNESEKRAAGSYKSFGIETPLSDWLKIHMMANPAKHSCLLMSLSFPESSSYDFLISDNYLIVLV